MSIVRKWSTLFMLVTGAMCAEQASGEPTAGKGRFVRVEPPDNKRILCLAEVSQFVGWDKRSAGPPFVNAVWWAGSCRGDFVIPYVNNPGSDLGRWRD